MSKEQVYITRTKSFRVVRNAKTGEYEIQKAGYRGVWLDCVNLIPITSLARAKRGARFWAGC